MSVWVRDYPHRLGTRLYSFPCVPHVSTCITRCIMSSSISSKLRIRVTHTTDPSHFYAQIGSGNVLNIGSRHYIIYGIDEQLSSFDKFLSSMSQECEAGCPVNRSMLKVGRCVAINCTGPDHAHISKWCRGVISRYCPDSEE